MLQFEFEVLPCMVNVKKVILLNVYRASSYKCK